jgi:hypothetical protein
MSWCRVGRGVVLTLAVAAIIASCGGSDGGGENGAAPATADSDAPASTEAPAADDSAADVEQDESSGESADESSDESDDNGGTTTDCDAIFSMAEMEEFFAEPVELTEETNDSLGQLVCTWESIEDPDDLEDLAFQLLVLQFYSGSPIEASAFFDPTMFDTVTTIEGIGDLAYTSGTAGMDYYFVDEPVGGSLSYMETDMGNTDAQPLHTSDDVEQLFRTFHDRVT